MPQLTGSAACAHSLLGWQARVPWVPSVWRAGSAEFWGAGDPGERGQRPFIFTAAVIIIQPQGELGGGRKGLPKGPPNGLPGETRSSGTGGHGEVTHTATAGSKNGCKDAKTFSRCEQRLAPNANQMYVVPHLIIFELCSNQIRFKGLGLLTKTSKTAKESIREIASSMPCNKLQNRQPTHIDDFS